MILVVYRKFNAHAECFLWTKSGIIMTKELSGDDVILGINSRGTFSWEPISTNKKFRSREFCRLIMDQGDSLVAKDSWIFTTRGSTRARDVVKGTVIELTGIPKMQTYTSQDSTKLKILDLQGNQYELDAGLSYIFGLQKRIKRVGKDKVKFFADEKNAIQLAKIVTSWLRKHQNQDSIFFKGNKVIVKSKLFADVCNIYELLPPMEVRNSKQMLSSFLKGFVESCIMIDRYQKPPFYLQIPLTDQVISRFIVIALRYFGIAPQKVMISQKSGEAKKINLFIKELDFKKIIAGKIGFEYGKIKNYSAVKEIIVTRGDSLSIEIQSEDKHWSPVVDMIPLHAIP